MDDFEIPMADVRSGLDFYANAMLASIEQRGVTVRCVLTPEFEYVLTGTYGGETVRTGGHRDIELALVQELLEATTALQNRMRRATQ